MTDDEIYDKIYDKTMQDQVMNLPRLEQIKRYIELYKDLKKE